MPDKVTISYRGAKYEIGRGKRYYGIWVAGAPASDPIDRWPETREGWTQAWARFTAIETPGTIVAVETPRGAFRLPVRKRSGPGPAGAPVTGAVGGKPAPARAARAAGTTAAVCLLGIGVLLGLIGLFPGYIGSQSLASQADELVPHLMYLVAWAASCVLIAVGASRARPAADAVRAEPLHMGALLGTGLSAVTFGLFLADLGEVIAGGSSLLGTGLVLSLLGWAACAAGSLLALTVRPRAAAAPSPATPPQAAPSPADAQAAPSYAAGPSFAAPQPGWPGRTEPGGSGPARPRLTEAGPLGLVILAAIGTVAAFAPSWDSYTLTQVSTGFAQTITLGNAFANPGAVIAGNVAVMIAVVAVAALAALWRPARHGAMLLAGATVPMVGQAISALLQVSQPTTAAQLGIPPAEAAGLSITSGVTPIFWVYCVFVISLVVSCAWMLTTPHYPAMPAAPQAAELRPPRPFQDMDGEDADDGDDAEDDEETTFA